MPLLEPLVETCPVETAETVWPCNDGAHLELFHTNDTLAAQDRRIFSQRVGEVVALVQRLLCLAAFQARLDVLLALCAAERSKWSVAHGTLVQNAGGAPEALAVVLRISAARHLGKSLPCPVYKVEHVGEQGPVGRRRAGRAPLRRVFGHPVCRCRRHSLRLTRAKVAHTAGSLELGRKHLGHVGVDHELVDR